jgi:hypothetical protein
MLPSILNFRTWSKKIRNGTDFSYRAQVQVAMPANPNPLTASFFAYAVELTMREEVSNENIV